MATNFFDREFFGIGDSDDSIGGHIEDPLNGTYVLDEYSASSYGIMFFAARLSAGSLTAAIQINDVNVGGLSGLSITSTQSKTDSTSAFNVEPGDRVTLVVTSGSSPADLTFTLGSKG